MKTLNLLRHAKSSWQSPQSSDIERPLNGRGEAACVAMAQPIANAGCRFDYVVASPALRAQQTIAGIANELQIASWTTEEALYTFDWRELLGCVQRLDDSYAEALLIGHNPATTEFCNRCSDGRIDNVPTCGFLRFEFAVDSWRAVTDAEPGRLLQFLSPKTL